jgi:hypothetical protein
MEWKQPEGLRRHWVLKDLDAELLFNAFPPGSAQARIGDDVYDLRESGTLRKKRTLSSAGQPVATLEQRAAGAAATLHYLGAEYLWKPANALATRWTLDDPSGTPLFHLIPAIGLAKGARVEFTAPPAEAAPLLMLCWYVMVL